MTIISGGQSGARPNLSAGLFNGGTKLGNFSIDWSKGNAQRYVLGNSVTVTFDAPSPGEVYVLKLKQDSVGGRTVAWPTTVKWESGATPTLTVTPNLCDILVFFWDGVSGNFNGLVSGQGYVD